MSHHDPRRIEAVHPDWRTVWMDGRTGTDEGRIRAIEETIVRVNPGIVVLNNLQNAFEAVRRVRYRGRALKLLAVNHGSWPHHAAALVENQDVLDAAVAVNALSASALRLPHIGMRPERVFHVPNAVAPPVAPQSRGRDSTAPLRVGYAARIDEYKHAAQLVPFFRELAVALPDAELWIAGHGELEPYLRRELAGYGERVCFFGLLTRTELYQRFYPEIDVFVSFCPTEGWPLAIAEAMVHGVVPVVAHYTGLDQENVLLDGQNSLLFPVDAIAAAVAQVLRLDADRAKLCAISKRAMATIGTEFLTEHFGQRWDRVLKAIVALPPLPGAGEPASLRRTGRFGLPERWLETGRRLLCRRVAHATAQEEWPSLSASSAEIGAAVSSAMAEADSRAVHP